MALRHVVIGGGSGFIGSVLVQALEYEGSKISVISRMPGPGHLTWSDIQSNGLPADTTAVVNLTGQNVLDPGRRWTPGFKQNIWNSRVQSTKILANAVSQLKDVHTFATISGVAYYKPGNDLPYTEDDRCETYDFFSELCRAWESAAQLSPECNTKQVVIRSGIVLGRTGGMIAQTYWPFFFGVGGRLGTGKQYMPWIHVVDLAYLFIHALSNRDTHPILNGVAPQMITNQEFTDEFAKAMWRPALIPMPEFALQLAFGKDRAKIMLEGQKVQPKRVLESGFEFQYPDIKSACAQVAIRSHDPF